MPFSPFAGASPVGKALLGLSVLGMVLAAIMIWEFYNAQQGTAQHGRAGLNS